jgi:hypothetical protein
MKAANLSPLNTKLASKMLGDPLAKVDVNDPPSKLHKYNSASNLKASTLKQPPKLHVAPLQSTPYFALKLVPPTPQATQSTPLDLRQASLQKDKAPGKRTQSEKHMLRRHMNANNKFILQGYRSKPMQNAKRPQAHQKIAEAQRQFRERQLQSQQLRRDEGAAFLNDGSFRRMIDPTKVERFAFESEGMDTDFGENADAALGPAEVVRTPDCSAINFVGEECQEDYVNTNIRKSDIRHEDLDAIIEGKTQALESERHGAPTDAKKIDQSLIDEL